jgi:hypothetical protein
MRFSAAVHLKGDHTMEPVVDFLAEEELKTAEQLISHVFDVKQVRPVGSAMDREETAKARKAKHERMAKLVVSLRAKAAGAGR